MIRLDSTNIITIYPTKPNNSYMVLAFEKNSVVLRGEDAKEFAKYRNEKTEYTENTQMYRHGYRNFEEMITSRTSGILHTIYNVIRFRYV